MRVTNIRPLVRLFNWWHGTRVRSSGPDHRLALGNARLRDTLIELEGSGAQLVLGPDVRLFGCHLHLRGHQPRLELGPRVCLRDVRIVVEDDGSTLLIGEGTSMTGAILQAKEGGRVEFGPDCMVGAGVEVSNSDSHSLLDASTGARLNPARDIRIGDHVWLGSGAWIAKGVTIGPHAVIGARSRVHGQIPTGALALGSPATVKRLGVTWSRDRLPTTS
jgi:acetyltransferase-like isoleucine patch superfamily enzyme